MTESRHLRLVSLLVFLLSAAVLLGACGAIWPNSQLRLKSNRASSQSTVSAEPSKTSQERANAIGNEHSVSTQQPKRQASRHIVQKGDTLYSIARAHRVPLKRLIEDNKLAPPYNLVVGDVLRVSQQRTHSVQNGETIYSIARRQGVPVPELIRLNQLSPPFIIKIGDLLSIPEPFSQESLRTANLPPSRPGRGFAWPARGKIIAQFGTSRQGVENVGIDIALPYGAPVRAAADGIVVYSGNRLRGYGNLLLIRHSSGYLTAYAYNSRLLAQRGDRVQRGQLIARAGNSGDVEETQLHFEIRKGSIAIDPERLLAPLAEAKG